jgi:hypothetical protein
VPTRDNVREQRLDARQRSDSRVKFKICGGFEQMFMFRVLGNMSQARLFGCGLGAIFIAMLILDAISR